MSEIIFRCSSLGRIMTEPKTKAEGILSVGAKTYIRELAAQDIFGVEFSVTSKYMEKGLEVEEEGIQLLNRVRSLDLAKNVERKTNGFISGECDIYDAARRTGHDIKSSWSIATFPICAADGEDKLYAWQMAGYLMLWDADEWVVDYVLVNTPERLVGYEPLQMHIVDHIPEHMRVTSCTIKRDLSLEVKIMERISAARTYYREVVTEFERTHTTEPAAPVTQFAAPATPAVPAAPYTLPPGLARLLQVA